MWLEYAQNSVWKSAVGEVTLAQEIPSKLQKIEIYTNDFYGNILVCNNNATMCEKDVASYSEMLAHVPLCSHPEPKRVLLVGAGISTTLGEILRHEDVEAIDAIEMDEALIEASKQAFSIHAAAFEDTRLTCRIDNGAEVIRNAEDGSYDVVIISEMVLDKALHAHLARITKADGIVVCESGNGTLERTKQRAVLEGLNENFRFALPYTTESLLYAGGMRTFAFASKRYHPTADIRVQKSDMIDGLSHYDADLHRAAFALPKSHFKALQDVMGL